MWSVDSNEGGWTGIFRSLEEGKSAGGKQFSRLLVPFHFCLPHDGVDVLASHSETCTVSLKMTFQLVYSLVQLLRASAVVQFAQSTSQRIGIRPRRDVLEKTQR